MRERAATTGRNGWRQAAATAWLLLYLVLFFLARDERWQRLVFVFLPDEVLSAWAGGSRQHVGLLDRVPVLLVAGLIGGCAYGWGRLSLTKLPWMQHATSIERVVFALGVGLSELSLVTLILGLCGLLHQRWLFAGVIAGGIGAAIWQTVGDRRRRPAAAAPPAAAQPAGARSWWERGGVWLAAPFVAVILLGGMLPPWEFDVREYHLQVPKEWFQRGRIEFLPHNVYGNMPLGAELHALLAMTLMGGPRPWWWGALAGKTVIAAFAPLTALALLAAGQRCGSRTAGIVAALVYLSIPWVTHVSVCGLIDGVVGFYLLLACYALWLAHPVAWDSHPGPAVAWDSNPGHPVPHAPHPEQPSASLLEPIQKGVRPHELKGPDPFLRFFAGFLAGSAAACKYPAILFVVVPLTVAIFFCRRACCWKPAGCFLLAAAAAGGLWYAKNAVFTGNPVYPLVWGGATRTPEKMAQWNRAHQVPRDEEGRRYTAVQAIESAVNIGWGSAGLSPLLVPLAVLGVLAGRPRRLVLGLAGLLGYFVAAWWLCTHRIDRFLIPALPLAALLAGVGAAWSAARGWRLVLAVVLPVGLATSFLYNLAAADQDHRYLVALEDLRRDVPAELRGPSRVDPAHRYLNDVVTDGGRVLLVGDAQPFDLEVPVLYSTCFDDCLFEQLLRGRTRDQRRAALEERRISHVYVRWSEIDRYRRPGNYGFTDWVTRPLVRDELVRDQQLLRPVDVGLDPDAGELFEVPAVAEDEAR